MNKPHKHAAVIKAWADGAEIEWKNGSKGWCLTTYPSWDASTEYRVKPQPHKWQKEIDAALAGKIIQYRMGWSGWTDWKKAKQCASGEGLLAENVGFNSSRHEFRIKPEAASQYWFFDSVSHRMLSDTAGGRAASNLKLTFEDDKLIGAEVL